MGEWRVPPAIIRKESENYTTILTKFGVGLVYEKCVKCGRPVAPILHRCPMCGGRKKGDVD